ncbi:MAG: S8 family peptidase [Clostridiales bacterium]|nr:S8 family peptidase [Clostridiales bacterium]
MNSTVSFPALSEDDSDIIVRTVSSDVSLPFSGSRIQPVNAQYTIFYAPLSEQLATVEEVGYSSVPKLFTEINAVSLEAAGILSVRIQPYLELSGEGILVGFLDSGIDYTLPAFRKEDGTTRIVRFWDQSDTRGTPPEGILYGSEYTEEDINRALFSVTGAESADHPASNDTVPPPVPRADAAGHGTAAAGIACGSADAGEGFTGAAPGSAIAFVRLKPAKQYLRDYFRIPDNAAAYQENDLMVGVRYLLDCAKQLQMPLVICLSLGTSQGGHTGDTPLENVLEAASALPGVCAVAGTGNETGLAHHISGTLPPSGSGEAVEAELLVDQETDGFSIEFWTDPSVLCALGFTSPLGETFSPVLPGFLPAAPLSQNGGNGLSAGSGGEMFPKAGATREFSFLLERSRILLTGAVTEAPFLSRVVLLRFLDPTPGVWKIRIVPAGLVPGDSSVSDSSADHSVPDSGVFHMWLPISGLVSSGIRFSSPDPDTTLVIPSCAPSVLSVGTWNAYDGSLYPYSGRGYTRSGLIKPDFVSPGVRLTCPAANGTYSSLTGSCAASALAAGAAALLLESGLMQEPPRYFSAEELKALFLQGAEPMRAMPLPNREWGYGVMNVYRIFESFREA